MKKSTQQHVKTVSSTVVKCEGSVNPSVNPKDNLDSITVTNDDVPSSSTAILESREKQEVCCRMQQFIYLTLK